MRYEIVCAWTGSVLETRYTLDAAIECARTLLREEGSGTINVMESDGNKRELRATACNGTLYGAVSCGSKCKGRACAKCGGSKIKLEVWS